MGEKIKEFNKRNAVYLNAIIGGINQSEYANLISDIKYYKLSFGNQNEQNWILNVYLHFLWRKQQKSLQMNNCPTSFHIIG